MLQEQFHQNDPERAELFNKLPKELQSKHIDDSIEELEKVVEEREKIGQAPDIKSKYKIDPKTGILEKKQKSPDKETWH
jgi:hypothetical protein